MKPLVVERQVGNIPTLRNGVVNVPTKYGDVFCKLHSNSGAELAGVTDISAAS